MHDVASLLALAVFAYLGFAMLALSQRRNWSTIMGSTPISFLLARALRFGGGASLAVSLAIALVRDGAAFGAILWVVMLTIAGSLVVVTLTWRASTGSRPERRSG